MRARGEDEGEGQEGGIEKRFRDAFKLSLPLLSLRFLSFSPPSGPKLLFFPATFKLCYLFTEFFPYFLLLLLLRPGIESYFQRKRRPIIKTFSPSLLPSVIQLPRLSIIPVHSIVILAINDRKNINGVPRGVTLKSKKEEESKNSWRDHDYIYIYIYVYFI